MTLPQAVTAPRGAPAPAAAAAARAAYASLSRPLAALEGQRGHLFPWSAAALGAGIALWFAFRVEPGPPVLLALGLLALPALWAALRGPEAARPLAAALALVLAGIVLAGLRAAAVSAPVLPFRYHGAVEGRIVAIDRSQADRLRLTLDRVVLERLPPGRTPERVRIALHAGPAGFAPEAGQTVLVTAHLAPPEAPVEPGDFDFRRHAWFERLGAVGYARTPVMLLEPAAPGGAAVAVTRLRLTLAEAIRARIPGDPGGLAAAVTTGDRSGLSMAATEAMRDANLYHIVSISGMHMGMLAAFVFGLVRTGLALVPPLALRLNGKKLAAVVALAASAGYLVLAGRDVATERAFVMVAVMLVAVLLDRRALSLRSVAIAALVVLALRPETILNPGFQMSFAATAALVAVFEGLREAPERWTRWPRWAAPAVTLAISSFVAGWATAPFGALHFNRVADYGLIANFLAVPAMGLLVMPGAVLAGLGAPVGLGGPGLWLMDVGCRWTLWVSAWVAELPGAVRAVPAPPGAVLPLLAAGGLVLILWRGWGRVAGVVPVAAAILVWAMTDRPVLLIAGDGSLVGVATPEGRALSRASSGLVARAWLENDGDDAGPAAAAARPGWTGPPGARVARVAGREVVHVQGRGWEAALTAACTPGRIVVTARTAPGLEGGCELWDARALALSGALAGRIGRDGALVLTSAKTRGGRRHWSGAGCARAPQGARKCLDSFSPWPW